MALRNISWHVIKPGQIINFIYKSKGDTKGYRRTVLVLNPDYSYRKKSTGRTKRFVIGLVLDTAITTPITETKLERLFKKLGGLELEDGSLSADLPDRMTSINTTKLYNRLKTVVTKYDIWRSYDRRECRKRRVYLEIDYKGIPKDVLDKFTEEMMESKNIDFEM